MIKGFATHASHSMYKTACLITPLNANISLLDAAGATHHSASIAATCSPDTLRHSRSVVDRHRTKSLTVCNAEAALWAPSIHSIVMG